MAIAYSDYEGLVGDEFQLIRDGASSLRLVLQELTRHDTQQTETESFSIVFLGPKEPHLQQQIQTLQHPDLGPLTVFLVPINASSSGVEYQAVYNVSINV